MIERLCVRSQRALTLMPTGPRRTGKARTRRRAGKNRLRSPIHRTIVARRARLLALWTAPRRRRRVGTPTVTPCGPPRTTFFQICRTCLHPSRPLLREFLIYSLMSIASLGLWIVMPAAAAVAVPLWLRCPTKWEVLCLWPVLSLEALERDSPGQRWPNCGQDGS